MAKRIQEEPSVVQIPQIGSIRQGLAFSNERLLNGLGYYAIIKIYLFEALVLLLFLFLKLLSLQ